MRESAGIFRDAGLWERACALCKLGKQPPCGSMTLNFDVLTSELVRPRIFKKSRRITGTGVQDATGFQGQGSDLWPSHRSSTLHCKSRCALPVHTARVYGPYIRVVRMP